MIQMEDDSLNGADAPCSLASTSRRRFRRTSAASTLPLTHFTLKNDKGEEESWSVEAPSPGNMLANGWTKNTFKPGDELLVSFVPAKDDRHWGTCTQFVFIASGRRVSGNGMCGFGPDAYDANALPVRPGYTAVEVKLPRDTRPESEIDRGQGAK
jgi:hypothetical protein